VLGRAPTTTDVTNFGTYSWRPYRGRWETLPATLEAAGIDPETGEVVEPLAEFLDRMGDA
jgi:broad specificity phosphatase PhoE